MQFVSHVNRLSERESDTSTLVPVDPERHALEVRIEHAKNRVTFGQPLADRQAIQWMIADSAVEIEATKWITLRAAWLADRGQDNRHQAAMAKLYGANMANRVVDRMLQIHGGMGMVRSYPVERFYRDVRSYRIGEGTSEIQRMIIARDIAGQG